MCFVYLKSNNGVTYKVDRRDLYCSNYFPAMINFDVSKDVYILEEVDSSILEKILDWANYVRNNANLSQSEIQTGTKRDLTSFERSFLNVTDETLFELIFVANYYDIPSLLEATTTAASELIVKYSPEELREMFSINNDFTEEEERKLYQETQWIEDFN